MTELRKRIIEAHGGEARWRAVQQVMACVSMGGMEFTSRFQVNPLRSVELSIRTASPDVAFADYPASRQVARFQPSRVWVEDAGGGVLMERTAPGAVFRSLRHWFLWDTLDVVYYCGMTLWQALCLPFSLLRSGCELEELEPVDLGDEHLQRLRVVLPADIPSFAPEQIFHVDGTGLVRRVDYAPNLYGSWMRVAQLMDGFETVDGLVLATRRRIHVALPNGGIMPGIPLGWMDLDDVGFVQQPPVDS
ncbi:MAG: hypothetical protein JJT90_00175 [Ectothiorhodospiraceae bacterium]|nr:hypothetical protein [Ectothiorhodospiraceae bacterium]